MTSNGSFLDLAYFAMRKYTIFCEYEISNSLGANNIFGIDRMWNHQFCLLSQLLADAITSISYLKVTKYRPAVARKLLH